MKSMTGFGVAQRSSNDFNIEVRLRSVNGRFSEYRFHAPKEYLEIENKLKEKASHLIRRGTIDIFVSRKKSPSKQTKLNLDKDALKNWHKTLTDAVKVVGGKEITPALLFSKMEHFIDVEEVVIQEKEKKQVLSLFLEALEKLDLERVREGKSISKHLLELLFQLNKEVTKIKTYFLSEKSKQQDKLKQKCEKLKVEIDPARFETELVMMLDRMDISEELQRLEQHVENFKNILKSKTEIGKKLDFYCQELLREVNTIGSKSISVTITECVVESKTLVEKIREQVQNIE